MKIRTLKNKIIVEQIKPGNVTKGGIVLICDEGELPDFRECGKVIAIGPDVFEVEIGDKITFGRYARVKIRIEKKEYLVVKEPDVLWKE